MEFRSYLSNENRCNYALNVLNVFKRDLDWIEHLFGTSRGHFYLFSVVFYMKKIDGVFIYFYIVVCNDSLFEQILFNYFISRI